MTWQVGAFTILFVALVGGFAWYERQRPDARVVALVATLAALAALGRIAFAALPNVKPTTDIVLIAGYALGPGPGFAVGAIAGLTSNFFFGQGPWTPWQMAAWGVTGVLGAGLALLTGRRIGRWTLALACGIVGFAFTVFQDVGDWVTYSDHSPAQLGVYVGKGLGFDAVHAVGCVIFALAFGPALTRSVTRFARRLDVTWSVPDGAVIPVLLVGALVAGLAAHPGTTGTAAAASTPVGYLQAAQNQDGGFGSAPGQPSSQLYSGWAALGLAAEGINPNSTSHGGASLISYLAGGARGLSDPGSVERTILAVRAAGLDPTAFGGRNLVAALQGDIRSDGSVSDQTNLTAFAILALRADGVAPPSSTVDWLLGQPDADGGFNFAQAGGLSDVDDTGAVLEALAGVPGRRASRVRSRAVSYIQSQQDRDGGFPAVPGAGSNAQSTAWAIQGLMAVGVNPNGVRRGGASPVQYLDSLTAPDGHIRYSRSSDQTPVWVTAEALMALAGKSLPFPPLGGAGPAAPAHQQQRAARHIQSAHAASVRPAVRRIRRRTRASAGRRLQPPNSDPGLMGYVTMADALALAPVGLG